MAFGLSRFRLSQVLTHIGHMAQGMVLLDVEEHEPVTPVSGDDYRFRQGRIAVLSEVPYKSTTGIADPQGMKRC
jgi:hypothetical protein